MQSFQNYKNHFDAALKITGEIGYVNSVFPPIARISGLPGARYGEVLYFETGEMGIVFSLAESYVEALVFSVTPVKVDTRVSRSNSDLTVPTGSQMLGLSLDALGNPVHAITFEYPSVFAAIENTPPGIDARSKINKHFETGVVVVDLMIPLGKGQRELVLGDRQTGKTEFLLQTLLTQAKKDTVCIYANIGKKKADIKRVEEFIHKHGIEQNVILISSSSTDPLAMIYITPYSAMTLAEYFVSIGKDVVLILDDLSTHAKFYREISLIAKRFPGRNSYPGDIFYTHSRLLERGGNFTTKNGIHSITCLVAAESIEGDISGYVQTSLMSITDGHIFFDHELFEQGRRPAVNYFLSVTRVGRQTQSKLRWGINRELSSFLTLYEKTQKYIHFGAEINEGIRSTLSMGSKILYFFDQPMGTIVNLNLQIFMFCLIWIGAVSEESATKLNFFISKTTDLYSKDPAFKKDVDTLIEESPEFNVLLGKLSSKSSEFMNKLKV